jgi:hypothetical protein
LIFKDIVSRAMIYIMGKKYKKGKKCTTFFKKNQNCYKIEVRGNHGEVGYGIVGS